jgi:ABC-2 type transport system permease protein
MRALLSVELRRLLARRLVRVMGAVVLLGVLIAGIATAAKSHRADIATLEAQARAEHDQIVNECLRGEIGPPSEELPPGESRDQLCQSLVSPGFRDPRFHLASLVDVFKGTTVPMILIAWILSASFIGAEWHAGTVATMLTWEPRRLRVLLSKVVICVAVAFAATVLFQALLLGALTPAAVLRGTTEGVDGAWFRELAGVVLRGGALASMAAGIGFSIAAIARGTAAALGVGFGYLLVVEQLLGGVRPGWRSWFFTWNSAVFVHGSRLPDAIPRSLAEAALLLSLYALGTVALGLIAFRTRDVT